TGATARRLTDVAGGQPRRGCPDRRCQRRRCRRRHRDRVLFTTWRLLTMPITARFDFSGDMAVKQGMPLIMPFAPEEPDGTRKDYTGHAATFQMYAAPATLDSLHDQPPILSLTEASGAIEL